MATGGDSGSPAFIGVNGALVPWGHSAWLGQTGTIVYADQALAIEAAMNSLATAAGDPAAGTYAVQTVNLSGFTNYA